MTRIVVGVDTSESSTRALQWAVEEGRLRSARVEAVHVWHLPVFIATPFGDVPIDTGEIGAEAQAAFDAVVDSVDTSGLDEPVVRTFVAGAPAVRRSAGAAGRSHRGV